MPRVGLRYTIHIYAYGAVATVLILLGCTFSGYAMFQRDSVFGKVWLAGPSTMAVGLVLCGKVLIDWSALSTHENDEDSLLSTALPELHYHTMHDALMVIHSAATSLQTGTNSETSEPQQQIVSNQIANQTNQFSQLNHDNFDAQKVDCKPKVLIPANHITTLSPPTNTVTTMLPDINNSSTGGALPKSPTIIWTERTPSLQLSCRESEDSIVFSKVPLNNGILQYKYEPSVTTIAQYVQPETLLCNNTTLPVRAADTTRRYSSIKATTHVHFGTATGKNNGSMKTGVKNSTTNEKTAAMITANQEQPVPFMYAAKLNKVSPALPVSNKEAMETNL